jgi:hypothetical protein
MKILINQATAIRSGLKKVLNGYWKFINND